MTPTYKTAEEFDDSPWARNGTTFEKVFSVAAGPTGPVAQTSEKQSSEFSAHAERSLTSATSDKLLHPVPASSYREWGVGLAKALFRKLKRFMEGNHAAPPQPGKAGFKPDPLNRAVTEPRLISLRSELAFRPMRLDEVRNVNSVYPRPPIRRLQDVTKVGLKKLDSDRPQHREDNPSAPKLKQKEDRIQAMIPVGELPPSYETSQEAARLGLNARSRPVYERELTQGAQARNELVAHREQCADPYSR